jgi:hypothetical protein
MYQKRGDTYKEIHIGNLYQKDLLKLKRKQVYLDSTIVLQPK